jgi:hypothetical protein
MCLPAAARGTAAETQAPTPASERRESGATDGAAAFERIESLVGEWEAPFGTEVMTDFVALPTQDWQLAAHGKDVRVIRLAFTRRK